VNVHGGILHMPPHLVVVLHPKHKLSTLQLYLNLRSPCRTLLTHRRAMQITSPLPIARTWRQVSHLATRTSLPRPTSMRVTHHSSLGQAGRSVRSLSSLNVFVRFLDARRD
jgi:hypothetical protein